MQSLSSRCAPGFFGESCADGLSICDVADPCQNGGTCTELDGEVVCECTERKSALLLAILSEIIPVISDTRMHSIIHMMLYPQITLAQAVSVIGTTAAKKTVPVRMVVYVWSWMQEDTSANAWMVGAHIH